jgi:hypothetical protein
LTFGPAESEVFRKLEKHDGLPDNKSEMFRRSLHAAGYLAEIDELSLRSELMATLSIAPDSPDVLINLTNAKKRLSLLLAVSAVKNGPNRDQFLDNLLRQLETYREKLIRYIAEKKKNTELDPKDPFIQTIRGSLRTLGEAMEKVYYKDDDFALAAYDAIYSRS